MWKRAGGNALEPKPKMDEASREKHGIKGDLPKQAKRPHPETWVQAFNEDPKPRDGLGRISTNQLGRLVARADS